MFQEYADTPALIEIKLERGKKSAVSSDSDLGADLDLLSAVIPGGYYALRDPDHPDEFIICNVLKCTPDYFEGQVYSKTDSYDMDEMCFLDSNVVTRFTLECVVTQLLSARKLKNIVIVDSSEIEEIFVSSIEDC